ncbi:MAG: Hsp20/alpha crystallin family protein [Nitrosospira sp.]
MPARRTESLGVMVCPQDHVIFHGAWAKGDPSFDARSQSPARHASAFMIITLPAFQLATGIFSLLCNEIMYLVWHTVEMRAHVAEPLVKRVTPLRSNVENIEARLRNGVLTITLPKAGK